MTAHDLQHYPRGAVDRRSAKTGRVTRSAELSTEQSRQATCGLYIPAATRSTR